MVAYRSTLKGGGAELTSPSMGAIQVGVISNVRGRSWQFGWVQVLTLLISRGRLRDIAMRGGSGRRSTQPMDSHAGEGVRAIALNLLNGRRTSGWRHNPVVQVSANLHQNVQQCICLHISSGVGGLRAREILGGNGFESDLSSKELIDIWLCLLQFWGGGGARIGQGAGGAGLQWGARSREIPCKRRLCS